MTSRRRTPREIKLGFPHLYYSPKERRRIARSDAGPGRRFGVSVPETRPSNRPGTRSALIDVIMLSSPGMRRRYFWVDVNRENHVITISFTDNAPVDMASLLQELGYWRQATLVVLIRHRGICYDHRGTVL